MTASKYKPCLSSSSSDASRYLMVHSTATALYACFIVSVIAVPSTLSNSSIISRVSSRVSVSVAVDTSDLIDLRSIVFLRRESAPEIGKILKTLFAVESGRLLRKTNSRIQRATSTSIALGKSSKPILEESLKKMYCNNKFPRCLKVADLGCSSGPNTLEFVSEIMSIIADAGRLSNLKVEEERQSIQFFLNDLYGNDFNTVFKSIPHLYKRLEEDERDPPALVHRAYLEQFHQDLTLFLKLRAEELVASGAMLLTFFGRTHDSQLKSGWTLLGMALHDMLSQNLIEEEKLEEFNIPLYNPTEDEVREVIEEEGSFRIERLEVESTIFNDNSGSNGGFDDNMRSEFIAKHMRAASEPLLKSQFGEAVMDE
ncbi:7-methylxanthosine synthase 1-like isoform X2 [Senna tora]|uniref:7-methylxanthosine synthase 1-like isoform X2 n=1 Tax=Senna tora TaxID=362788 RepID=A0A834SWM6_9FABA|nr:7-methylxanthosine synthase 1-like isoform X2 [Senna tora]